MTRRAGWLIPLLLPGLAATAPKPIRSESDLVLVSATVVDRSEHFISTLHASDFRILERGVEQRISSFSLEDTPLSMAIVFDASGSMNGSLALARESLQALFEESNPADEFALFTVRSRPEMEAGFESRPSDLLNSLLTVKASGTTALFDTIYAAARYLKTGRNPRKALLIVSDGEDNYSRYTERELQRVLRETDATVYAIGVGVAPTPPPMPDDPNPQAGGDILAEIAEDTGGRYFQADSAKDLPQIVQNLAIRYQYVIGFAPPAQDRDGRYHRIDLKLAGKARQKHLRAYSRRGFYGPLASD